MPVACAKGQSLSLVETQIRDASGDLFEDAIPSVSIVKDGGYFAEEYFDDPSVTADLVALVEQKLRANRLGGFVAEKTRVPYISRIVGQTNSIAGHHGT